MQTAVASTGVRKKKLQKYTVQFAYLNTYICICNIFYYLNYIYTFILLTYNLYLFYLSVLLSVLLALASY